jgi:putative hydrolase of the HAD superfamily
MHNPHFRHMMVGDQIDRDIEPAKAAGFETVYFPSAFLSYWNVNQQSTADHQISRFDELVPFIVCSRDQER